MADFNEIDFVQGDVPSITKFSLDKLFKIGEDSDVFDSFLEEWDGEKFKIFFVFDGFRWCPLLLEIATISGVVCLYASNAILSTVSTPQYRILNWTR